MADKKKITIDTHRNLEVKRTVYFIDLWKKSFSEIVISPTAWISHIVREWFFILQQNAGWHFYEPVPFSSTEIICISWLSMQNEHIRSTVQLKWHFCVIYFVSSADYIAGQALTMFAPFFSGMLSNDGRKWSKDWTKQPILHPLSHLLD